MDKRAKLSVALIVVALGAGAVVATGLGADSGRPSRPDAPAAPTGTFLSEIATPSELKLWYDRGCATCHGPEARGGTMGPDLTKVVPLYGAKFGAAAADRLAAYVVDPAGSPKLRDDGVQFGNPMPPIEKLVGGTKADAATLAALLLRFAK